MKRILTGLTIAAAIMTQGNSASAEVSAQNPFDNNFAGVHGTAPFSKIANPQYEPAIDRGIALAQKEIEAITSNPQPPTFENTIVALERSGADLNRVLNVFFPLLSADADDEMMEISMRVTPKLSDYSTSITLNNDLWKRVKAVYENRDALNLNPEDAMLLQKTYDSFALSGADLEGADREKYKKLSAELSELTTKFGQNVLKELNTYEIWLTSDDLAGLPKGIVDEAAQMAEAKGRKGEFLFTLAQPTYMAFMKYSERPDLREKFSAMVRRNEWSAWLLAPSRRAISSRTCAIRFMFSRLEYSPVMLRPV